MLSGEIEVHIKWIIAALGIGNPPEKPRGWAQLFSATCDLQS
jgi:hypothetical protein